MSPTEAQKKAVKKYRKTEKGRAMKAASDAKYAQTPEGKEALKRASQKFEAENAEARREYKRLKAREYYLRKKAQSGLGSGGDAA